jgi:hypothetical protein
MDDISDAGLRDFLFFFLVLFFLFFFLFFFFLELVLFLSSSGLRRFQ